MLSSRLQSPCSKSLPVKPEGRLSSLRVVSFQLVMQGKSASRKWGESDKLAATASELESVALLVSHQPVLCPRRPATSSGRLGPDRKSSE